MRFQNIAAILWAGIYACLVLLQAVRMKGADFLESISSPISTDKITSPLCSREEIRDGQWVRQELDRPPYVSQNGRDANCFPERADLTASPFLTWDWETKSSTCHLAKWDPVKFCSLVKNRNIAFVGDSMTTQHFGSLVHLLGGPFRFNLKVCDESTKLSFTFDLELTFEDAPKDADIIILNRGAHYTGDFRIVSQMNQTLTALHKWQDACDKNGKDCLLFYRSTVPGHPDCLKYRAPVNNMTEMEHATTKSNPWYQGIRGGYNWWNFKPQNKMIEDMLLEDKIIFRVIDAYDLTILRPDLHVGVMKSSNDTSKIDCLHYCQPGPIDVWNRLLLHELIRAEESK